MTMMTPYNAITFCRKHLADHFNLRHYVDGSIGYMVGGDSLEAKDAYNALAELHKMIDKLIIEGMLK